MVKVTACWLVDPKSAVIHFQSRLLNDYNVYYVNSCAGSFRGFEPRCRYKLPLAISQPNPRPCSRHQALLPDSLIEAVVITASSRAPAVQARPRTGLDNASACQRSSVSTAMPISCEITA